MKIEKIISEELDAIGNDHFSKSAATPLREDAFKISKDEKILLIQEKVKDILDVLGMDLNDDSLKGTPLIVAKMFVNEIFGGLDPKSKPKASTFENSYKYGEMLVEKNIITLSYSCSNSLGTIIKFLIGSKLVMSKLFN